MLPPTGGGPTPVLPPTGGGEGLTDADVASAQPVTLPVDQSGLVVTLEEPDVFAFPLSVGDTVQVDALFASSSGDV
ncbi:MAG: hypothetical protein U1B78_00170, partial [Dehalococcoidia bacterium]|nr:hypothetical protein [Dehalococcoidia bacterium]